MTIRRLLPVLFAALLVALAVIFQLYPPGAAPAGAGRISGEGVVVGRDIAATGNRPDGGGDGRGRGNRPDGGDPAVVVDSVVGGGTGTVSSRIQAQPAPPAAGAGYREQPVAEPGPGWRDASLPADRETYADILRNPLRRAALDPVSTFGVDVDTASYANVRRFLMAGGLPPTDAVRIEELINYFDYDYALPADRARPFGVDTEVGVTPWNPDTLLLRIGIRGWDIPREERPPANLVFLIDVSGSMNEPSKLPLVVSSLRLLTGQLTAADRVSLVVYAGAAGVVLEPTAGDRHGTIGAALDRLAAGGSTAGGQGLRLAYAMAREGFVEGGINRVIIATDGDFNVGTTSVDSMTDIIARQRDSGISLTALGFGMWNLNDHMLERIADTGNGNYAYIDTLDEARKVLVDELSSTLVTIARDVKVRIEFNPAVVAEYRLIGYENRLLRTEEFDNDRVDAGDIGAGHTVTALYEIALVGGAGVRTPALRYGPDGDPDATDGTAGEFAFLRLRYKLPGEDTSRLIERPLGRAMVEAPSGDTSDDFRFAAAVAAFGEVLHGGEWTGEFSHAEILALARGARGADPHGWRAGFVSLVELARALGATGG